ncbi:phage major tail tube protein [Pasteurella skyensis]|uniref:Phage major tail tube protein n=1 Tax=Phocoenobacter skyensis TaxID=97481 RepID=A0AAJ6NAB2_9PAST|nr:phage major tail tube protein [Pasteurella skyensis]MDP8173137.1 phage major tail tube protein [Pasteurella skyensis]MDP8178930.1 phage major tail tube protein [Pasteurella skyensis]
MALPKTLKLMNVFLNGTSFYGVATEVELPKLSSKFEDYQAGGMFAPVEINLGMEKLELTHKYAGTDEKFYAGFAEAQIDKEMIRFAGSYEQDDTGEVTPVEVLMRGRHKEVDGGNSKVGEITETTIKSALTYYKLTMGGKDVIEIDTLNVIIKKNGKDIYQKHREAIGI